MAKILIVDDEPALVRLMSQVLGQKENEVLTAGNGQEALKLLFANKPDLVLLDVVMPGMDGWQTCKRIREVSDIPVIMLTGKGEAKDVVSGIEAGADDYLVKPFDPDTLLARIKMILRRTVRSLDANPLTHLPGNTSIMEEMNLCITSNKPFAVGYADLDKFKMYNDKYGFEKGDEVIRCLARILVNIVLEKGGQEAFVGHIGGDDFVFITADALVDDISQAIIKEFDTISPSLYNEEDRKAGYIVGKDRQGNEIKAGLLSVSIGIVSSSTQKITHVAQISEIGAELKKYAKSFGKSNFVRDQRKR